MSKLRYLILVAILAAVSGPAPAWAQRIPGTLTPLAPAAPAPPQPDIPANQMYGGSLIGVGDILDVRVNNEEDVSGRYQVNQEGKIELPLLSQASRRRRRDYIRSFEGNIQSFSRPANPARAFRNGINCAGDGTRTSQCLVPSAIRES